MMDDGMRDPKFGMILVHRYWIERTVGIWGFVEIKRSSCLGINMRISHKHFDFSKETVVCFTNELWMGSTKSRRKTGVLVISSHQLPAITCVAWKFSH
jgi:hypothetical protein